MRRVWTLAAYMPIAAALVGVFVLASGAVWDVERSVTFGVLLGLVIAGALATLLYVGHALFALDETPSARVLLAASMLLIPYTELPRYRRTHLVNSSGW